MKNRMFQAVVLTIGMLIFTACGRGDDTKTEAEKENMEAARLDSIALEMDKAAKIIEVETEQMKTEIDSLLEN